MIAAGANATVQIVSSLISLGLVVGAAVYSLFSNLQNGPYYTIVGVVSGLKPMRILYS